MHLVIKVVLEVGNFKNENLWTGTLINLQKSIILISNLSFKYLVDLSINKTRHIFELNLKIESKIYYKYQIP